MKPSTKLSYWLRSESANQQEKQRIAILTGPLPKNDPALFTPTRCKVLKAFCIKGKPVAVGEIIELPKHDATSLQAIAKIEIID